MIFTRIISWVKGYVIFDVTGNNKESFLNLAGKKNISLWRIKKTNSGAVRSRSNIRDFKKLRPCVKNTRVKLRIVKKTGLPFLLYKYRKRFGILTGCLMFFTVLWFLSSFVWIVNIDGCETVSPQDIANALGELNIKIGTYAPSIDVKSAEQSLILKFPNLKWAQIQIKGSKMDVFIKEGRMPPVVIPEGKPCDILAAKDGQIIELLVYKGVGKVRKLDTVKKGDLIVSGILESEVYGKRLVHSDAVIKALTANSYTVEVPLNVTESIATGKEYKRYRLQFFNISVKLYLSNNVPFEFYESEEKTDYLTLGKNTVLPLGIVTATYKEATLKEYKLTSEEALNEAKKKMKAIEEKELEEITVTDTAEFTEIKDDILYYEKIFYCEEDIGIEKEIIQEG